MHLDLKSIDSLSESALTFESCKNELNLSDHFDLKQLRHNFLNLSRLHHPDVNPNNRSIYLKITQSYEYLKELLKNNSIKANSSDQILTPKREKIESLSKKSNQNNSALIYTVKLDWAEVLLSWIKNQPYFKSIKYTYSKPCFCQQLCNSCKGSGYLLKSTCPSCSGLGWSNYCEECKGSGYTLLKDEVCLSLSPNQHLPPQWFFQNKGNQDNHDTRGPLILTFSFRTNVKKYKKVFLYEYNLTYGDLKQPTLVVPFSKTYFKIDVSKIKLIPYYHKISSFKLGEELNHLIVKLNLKLN